MLVFDIDAVRRALEAMDSSWKEFMRVETMSAGVYRLKAGELDRQKPHTEDEIYFVTKGRAKFAAGENVQDVSAGSIIYVEAGRDHRFIEIAEDLEALVIFTPAEGSAAAAPSR
ncbi:MAG: cupin domain-containing protein [Vicinamibacteria bacterium]|nr:cupin domain-containing protein [Vicinamibacteria bacterium]